MKNIKCILLAALSVFMITPTLMTNKEIYENISYISSLYGDVDGSYINTKIIRDFEYVRLFNIANNINRTLSNEEYSETMLSYISMEASKASKWKPLIQDKDKVLSTLASGMSSIGVNNENVKLKIETVMSVNWFKVLTIYRGFCYEIRFKAKALYLVLNLISLVFLGLIVYFVKFDIANPDDSYLYEEEDIELLDDEEE